MTDISLRSTKPPKPTLRLIALGLALMAGLGWAATAIAEGADEASAATGIVFEDRNRNGVRDAGEPGRPGVAVSDGRSIIRTDADGRYALPGSGRLVYITRPAGFDCAAWYRQAGGDFALTLLAGETREDAFFFLHISDAHVYPHHRDFTEHSSPPIPWFVPRWLADWLSYMVLDNFYGPMHGGDIDPVFREELRPHYRGSDLDALSGRLLLRAYQDEFVRPGSELGDVDAKARGAFAELSALGPSFIVNTGDLVLEGNGGSPEAVARWFDYYVSLANGVDAPIYETIGNNEIGGTSNEAWAAADPRFGKHFFRHHFGPTHYSFDRGDFHFVVLDTHRVRPGQDDPYEWSFHQMEDDVVEWARNDLALHRDRVVVVLNHEPFHRDPSWPFDDDSPVASDAGLFAEFGVAYALSGHTHWRGQRAQNGTHHLTAGALSGMRWVLPAGLHERGYMLFYARAGKLHGAWKRLHEPTIAATWPRPEDPSERIIAVSDVAGPFERVEVSHAGQILRAERWGDYFLRVRIDSTQRADIDVRAIRADGSTFERAISVD
jgi:hypothetical protein